MEIGIATNEEIADIRKKIKMTSNCKRIFFCYNEFIPHLWGVPLFINGTEKISTLKIGTHFIYNQTLYKKVTDLTAFEYPFIKSAVLISEIKFPVEIVKIPEELKCYTDIVFSEDNKNIDFNAERK